MPFKIGEDQPIVHDPNKTRFLFRSGDNIILTERSRDDLEIYAWHPGVGNSDKRAWIHVDEERRVELALAILPRGSTYYHILKAIVDQIQADVNAEVDRRFGTER